MIKFILLSFFITSCASIEDNRIDYTFFCEYLQQHTLLDGRYYDIPKYGDPKISESLKKTKIPDRLSPITIKLWNKSINYDFSHLASIPDSLSVTDTSIPLKKENILAIGCNDVTLDSLNFLPKRSTHRGFFILSKTPTVIIQLSDLYVDKNEEYGIIHFVYTTGFLDNTFSDFIIMEKKEGMWVLKK